MEKANKDGRRKQRTAKRKYGLEQEKKKNKKIYEKKREEKNVFQKEKNARKSCEMGFSLKGV